MPHITIEDETPQISYAVGASSTGPFAFNFPVFAQTDLKVYVDDELLVLATEYTVSLTGGFTGGYPGGTVTLVTAVASATVTIVRDLPIERTTDFPPSGPLHIDTLNTQLDQIVAMIQQLLLRLRQTLMLPEGSEHLDLLLPEPEALKMLRWRSDLLGLENITVVTTSPEIILSSLWETLLGLSTPAAIRTELGIGQTLTINTNSDIAGLTGSPPADLLVVRRLGYHTVGDLGAIDFVRRSSVPGHGEYFLWDGVVFEMTPNGDTIHVAAFGARAVNQDMPTTIATDFTPTIDRVHAYWAAWLHGASPYNYPKLRRAQLGSGWYACNTRPQDMSFKSIEWIGGPFTVIFKNFASAGVNDAIFNLRGGSSWCKFEAISFSDTAVSAGSGSYISLISGASQVNQCYIDRCQFSCANTNMAIVADGTAGAGNVDVRKFTLINSQCFGAITLNGVGSIEISGVNMSTSGVASALLAIGGNAGDTPQNGLLSGTFGGGIALGFCQQFRIDAGLIGSGSGTALNIDTCNDIHVAAGLISGNINTNAVTNLQISATSVVGNVTYATTTWAQGKGRVTGTLNAMATNAADHNEWDSPP